jgi:hypothetical protein
LVASIYNHRQEQKLDLLNILDWRQWAAARPLDPGQLIQIDATLEMYLKLTDLGTFLTVRKQGGE